MGELDAERAVIVYCRVGRRSATAAKLLHSRGFTEIFHLQGGIESCLGRSGKAK